MPLPSQSSPSSSQPSIQLSRMARRTREQPISALMAQALANPGLVSLAAGFVDAESLPTQAVAAAAADIMADPAAGRAALQYGTTAGFAALREKALARFEKVEGLPRSALKISADDIVITTGSQQLLYLLAETLLDEGDIVITSAPSYFVYSSLLDSFGIDVRSVTDDDGGMPVDGPDGLEALLEKLLAAGELSRVKLIYAVTYFQNPTGVSIAPERRPRIVELARKFSAAAGHRILILEDAAYRELRFDGPEGAEGPSLKRYDPDNGTVIHTTTFSKPFSPGMKTGWTILPTEVVGPLLRIKGNQDFGSSNLNQHLLNRVMADGSYDRQVERLRGVYRGKRNAMVSAVRSAFGHLAGRGCRWTEPTGGLYVWLTLPEGMDTTGGSPLFKAAVEEGVLYVPGDLAYNARPGRPVPKNKIRLCFGVATESEIRTGIARLAAAVAKVYGSNAAAPSAVKEPAGAAAGA